VESKLEMMSSLREIEEAVLKLSAAELAVSGRGLPNLTLI